MEKQRKFGLLPSLDTSSMQGNTSAVTPINQTPERAWELRHTFRQGWLTVHGITLRTKIQFLLKRYDSRFLPWYKSIVIDTCCKIGIYSPLKQKVWSLAKIAVFEDWISLFQQAIVLRECMCLDFKVKNKMHKSTWIISPRSKITKVSQNQRMFFPNPLSPQKLLSYIWKTKQKKTSGAINRKSIKNHSQTRLPEGHFGPVASFLGGHLTFPIPNRRKWMFVGWFSKIKPPLSKHLLWFRILSLNFDKVANWEITSTITPTNLGTTISLMPSKTLQKSLFLQQKNNLEVDVMII